MKNTDTTEPTTVDLRPNLCTCGCTSETNSRFKQGHDQRLKGQLRRAHTAGRVVTLVVGKSRTKVPAAQAVTYLDTPRFSWSEWLGVQS